MIETTKYSGTCWWCGNKSGSGEHKFKRPDLIREFKEFFKVGDVVKTMGDFDLDSAQLVQGPNSDLVKFEKNIFCQNCNNRRSQQMDSAYDKFVEYVKKEENIIFNTHSIDLIEIYGNSYKSDFKNLLRYYTKNICCRLAELDIFIAPEIIAFLDKKVELPSVLGLQFEIRTDWVEFYKHLKNIGEDYGFVHASGVEGNKPRNQNSYHNLFGHLQYRWLKVSYDYNLTKDYKISNNIYKGSLELLESYNCKPEEMKKKLKTPANKK
jgi:hypothetical protein